jgi:DNA-directed RNA polymerase subunit RPC12/RpoP
MTAAAYEKCGKTPMLCHCHGCGNEWRIGWMPNPIDEILKSLTDVSCPRCGDGAARLGPACSIAGERSGMWEAGDGA